MKDLFEKLYPSAEQQNQNQNQYSKLMEGLMAHTEAFLDMRNKDVSEKIENILRNHVTPPVRGVITQGKLRWRGINTVVYDEENSFIGIYQRDTLITIDGKKMEEDGKSKT